ncbi:ribosome modulation factor [Aquabacterium sp.]|jgi:ribosome modulation factor|uniref:ribosome modulation factor n=1 Tax=Aquabacterium sp. TaxID=1872578 RepID=UPI003BB15366
MLRAIGNGLNRIFGGKPAEQVTGVRLTPYETGHEAGINGTNEPNPYDPSDARHAPWQAGYDEGREAWVL